MSQNDIDEKYEKIEQEFIIEYSATKKLTKKEKEQRVEFIKAKIKMFMGIIEDMENYIDDNELQPAIIVSANNLFKLIDNSFTPWVKIVSKTFRNKN